MTLQVHDELVFEVPKKKWTQSIAGERAHGKSSCAGIPLLIEMALAPTGRLRLARVAGALARCRHHRHHVGQPPSAVRAKLDSPATTALTLFFYPFAIHPTIPAPKINTQNLF